MLLAIVKSDVSCRHCGWANDDERNANAEYRYGAQVSAKVLQVVLQGVFPVVLRRCFLVLHGISGLQGVAVGVGRARLSIAGGDATGPLRRDGQRLAGYQVAALGININR